MLKLGNSKYFWGKKCAHFEFDASHTIQTCMGMFTSVLHHIFDQHHKSLETNETKCCNFLKG